MGLEVAHPVTGAAIECRVYAEDPKQGFLPSPGIITRAVEPDGEGVRVDSALYPAMEVTPYYDSMLAKVITWGKDRPQALERMRGALRSFVLEGVKHTIPFCRAVLEDPKFISGNYNYALTNLISC